MTEVLLAVGPVLFFATAPSFQKLKTKTDARWASQPRLSRAPAHQFIGPGETTIDIDGVLYPHRFGDFGTVESLRVLCTAGQVIPLISISTGAIIGVSHGDYYVASVGDEREYFDVGQPRKITFNVQLKAYGGDNGVFGGLF